MWSVMKKPNFFILGAPKCGTTSLAQWLSEHPNIYMSSSKEPHYYSRDLRNQQARTAKEYAYMFKGVGMEHRAIGEASVWYLYSTEAVPNILSEVPDARFIVCLRNPVDMAYSLHGQQLVANNENIEDFFDAWKAQSARKKGKNIPAMCKDPRLLLYAQACSLGSQLERLYSICNHSQVKVIFLEDMKKDSRYVYEDVLQFLDVASDGRDHFPVVNVASERKSNVVSHMVKFSIQLGMALHIPRSRIITRIIRWLDRINQRKSSRPVMSDMVRLELESYFSKEIVLLEQMTKRDLNHWKTLV